MPFVKVMIHAVWGTKSRESFLIDEIRSKVTDHIRENCRAKEIYLDSINGYVDHLHCLFGLNATMSLSKAMQLIKGDSAFWINKNKLIRHKFEWADEYFAVSVSESMLSRVRTYIENQEEHHKKISFELEYQKFISKYGFRMPG